MARFPLARPQKNILCLEVFPDTTSGLLFRDGGDRQLQMLKWWREFEWVHFARRLSRWSFLPTVIVAAHPTMVYSAEMPFELVRESAALALGNVELENLLAQALTRVFNQKRREAAAALSTPELDTVLVQSHVTDFRAGEAAVLSPLGTKTKNLAGVMQVIFTRRTLFDTWKNFFNSAGGFYFADMQAARAKFLERAVARPFSFLVTEGDRSSIAVYPKTGSARTSHFPWSPELFPVALSAAWGTSREAARRAYLAFAAKAVSPHLAARLTTLFKPHLESLTAQLRRRRVTGTVFAHADLPMPHAAPHRLARATFEELPVALLSERLGFRISLECPLPPHKLFDYLAYYTEFYYDKNDTPANRWLRRRVHWLVPAA